MSPYCHITQCLTISALVLVIAGCMDDPQSTETRSRDVELSIDDSQLTALHVDERNRYVFVADAQQEAVHFVGTDNFSLQDTVTVGGSPFALDTSGDGDLLAAVSDDPPAVAIIDVNSRSVLGTVDMSGATPTSIAFDKFNRLYIGVSNDDETRAVRVYDITGPPPWDELDGFLPTADGYIAGRSRDRTKLYASDEGNSVGVGTAVVSQWNLEASPPAEMNNASLFGGTSVGNGWVLSTTDDSRLLVYGQGVAGADGAAFDDGMLPVYASESLGLIDKLDVEGCLPVAAAVTADDARIIVAHGGPAPNATRSCEAHSGDIHIYDAATFDRIAALQADDDVVPNGLAVGPDRIVYVLLTINRIGVYVR